MKHLCALILLLCCLALHTSAQQLAIKTNALYWATATPNLGFEVGLSPRTTLNLEGGYNPWTFDKGHNTKLKHWMVMPEFRYWTCERFAGHFFGVQSGYTYYNISGIRIPFHGADTKNHRYQGWATGAGLTYGYAWIVGRRWNIEASLGFGYVYTHYDRYDCATCGDYEDTASKHFFSPTKAAVSVIYMIK